MKDTTTFSIVSKDGSDYIKVEKADNVYYIPKLIQASKEKENRKVVDISYYLGGKL